MMKIQYFFTTQISYLRTAYSHLNDLPYFNNINIHLFNICFLCISAQQWNIHTVIFFVSLWLKLVDLNYIIMSFYERNTLLERSYLSENVLNGN